MTTHPRSAATRHHARSGVWPPNTAKYITGI